MRANVWVRSIFESLFRKAELDRNLDDELRSYLDLLIDEKVRAGMDPTDAARQARLALGGVEQVKENVRERRLGAALDTLWQDARFAVRTLRKNAAFTAVALLILAIGIGANTTLFSTVHAVLLRGVPYPQADRLVVGLKTFDGSLSGPVSRVDYYDYRDQSESFEQLAALNTFTMQHTVTGGDPELVEACYVTWNLFPTLGVSPVAGRGFLPSEEAEGNAPSVLISYGYWQRRFGGDAGAVGSTLVLDNAPLLVVGVMPRGFRFMYDADVWGLIDRDGPFDRVRASHSHWVVGRLKPGVTMAQAQAEVDAISDALAKQYPDSNEGKALALVDLQGYMVRDVRTSLLLLLGTTVLVLLIACGNVAGLLIARGERRLSEMAMRSALGASRRRLLRQLITESLILTLGAGLLGVSVAYLLQGILLRLLPIGELGIEPPSVSAAALLFTLAISIATGVMLGIVPAMRKTSLQPAQQLRSGTHATEGVGSGRLRGGLVVLQVALSVTLLVGSGLLIRSLVQLSTVELGFDSDNLLTAQLQIQEDDYPTPEERNLFFASLLEEVEVLPGVESATLANRLPIRSRWQDWSVWPVGQPPANLWEGISAMSRWVPPGYFETMGIPLLAGRDIAASDGVGAPYVIVVSKSVAESLFPGADPIGRMVNVSDWRELEVIGVVGDARINTLRSDADGAMYMAAAQMAPARLQIAIRTAGDPALLIRPIEELLRRKDPNVLFARPQTMSAVVDEYLSDFRTVILSLTLFSGVALVLAAVGLYGVLAYHVSQRQGEFGIRLAMGATAGDLIGMILGRGLALVALGLLIGLAVSYPGTLVLRQLLYETRPLDPAAYLGAVAFLGLVAALACFVPARRATRVDVADVLRIE